MLKKGQWYYKSEDKVEISEKPITKQEAVALCMVPLSVGIRKKDSWMIANMILDMQRLNINHALVKENYGCVSVWKATKADHATKSSVSISSEKKESITDFS